MSNNIANTMADKFQFTFPPRLVLSDSNGAMGGGNFFQLQRPRSNLSTSSASSLSSLSVDSSPSSDNPPTPTSPEVLETGPVSSSMECSRCLRPGAPLFCFACGFWMANGRVRQPCSQHPKVIFYTDFTNCPKCKQSGHLRELD